MRSRPVIAVLAATVLAACASPRAADQGLPGTYEAPATAVAAAPVALDRWWTAFEDAELNRLVDQALASSTDVRLAAARLQEARATRAATIASLLPSGDAKGSARRTETRQLSGTVVNIPGFATNGVSESYSANFDVSWEIDLFGRIFAAARAASADAAASRFAYEGVRASMAAQVADAYFQARGLAIQLEDARETARIQRSLYDLVAARARIGIVATSDPDRIAGELAQADARAASLEAELQVQRRLLLVLAGRTMEPTTAVDTPATVAALPAVPASLPSELLARRPDVREAQMRLKTAAGLQDVAALSFFPTFTLSPGLGWSKTIQPGFSSTSQHWSIGGMVTQPVLSIPRLLAELKAENARTEQAVIGYEKALQTAFQEAEAALVRLDADRRGVTLLVDGEARAARAYNASRIGYDRGLTDLQSALSAEQTWRNTRTQLTAAQVQALRRTVQAYKALGGGWSPSQPPPMPPRPKT